MKVPGEADLDGDACELVVEKPMVETDDAAPGGETSSKGLVRNESSMVGRVSKNM